MYMRHAEQNFEFPTTRPTTKFLGNETLVIADYKYLKIFRFVMLDIKLWIKDDYILYQD